MRKQPIVLSIIKLTPVFGVMILVLSITIILAQTIHELYVDRQMYKIMG